MLYRKNELDKHYMKEALRQATKAFDSDEVPVGTLVVCENKIVGAAYNQTKLLKDPTAHAEMIAITQATESLQSPYLSACTLYVTLEPCPMCVGAMLLARIKRLVFAAKEPKSGACGSCIHLLAEGKWNHSFKIEEGLMEFESAALLQEFFKNKRKT